jgi:bacterioferritin-associated ferredoxin
MYICICKTITESQLIKAIKDGYDTKSKLAELYGLERAVVGVFLK